jgi:hypothetical protein
MRLEIKNCSLGKKRAEIVTQFHTHTHTHTHTHKTTDRIIVLYFEIIYSVHFESVFLNVPTAIVRTVGADIWYIKWKYISIYSLTRL